MKQKDNIINNLLFEKEELLKKINNKDINSFLLEINYKQKYELLKAIVDNIEKENRNTKYNENKNINFYKDQIINLKNEINKNNKENLKRFSEFGNIYKNMMENLKTKEEKYKNEIIALNNIIKGLEEERESKK